MTSNFPITKISDFSVQLLRLAEIKPSRLDKSLKNIYRQRMHFDDWRSKYYCKKIIKSADAPIQTIKRRRHHILISAEWDKPFVRYIEEGKEKCYFEMYKTLPETILLATQGRKLGDVIEGLGVFSDLRIHRAEKIGGECRFYVKHTWLPILT